MELGISTSCFFPLETERALALLCGAQVGCTELFMNTMCETDAPFVDQLKEICDANGTRIVAFHPFTSGMEPLYFASSYPRRVADGIKLYRKLFACASRLGASIFTMHGDSRHNPVDFGYYCENFAALSRIARQDYGITLCQENVVRCKCGSVENILRMRRQLGDEVHFTLDVKQAVRSGEDLMEMIDAMGSAIAHLHISDHMPGEDCLPPGQGSMEYLPFFRRLVGKGFDGAIIIELYRHNFGELSDLLQAREFLRQQLQLAVKNTI
ncbi:MAG: sugar phosphate isomerase/epimerase [Pygmaiobacter massiliensis]|nr:sugar phosphate isomerase/epimerase [Pygmaiobacter massiliensis]